MKRIDRICRQAEKLQQMLGKLLEAKPDWSREEKESIQSVSNRIAETFGGLLIGQDQTEGQIKFRNLFQSTWDATILVRIEDDRIVEANQRCRDLLGYSPTMLTGMTLEDLISEDDYAEIRTIKNRTVEKGRVRSTLEIHFIHRDGHSIPVNLATALVSIHGATMFFVHVRDITRCKDLATEVERAEQMKAVGVVAGGVAHDLNNVLSGVVSYPDLVLMQIPEESPLREPILTMQNSGQKAARIVQDLLTMARRGVKVLEVTNLNDIIRDYFQSLEFKKLKQYHLNVTIASQLEADLLNLMGSPLHLSKVIMNLVSNAAEAMPDGGKVNILTKNRTIATDSAWARETGLAAGEYVELMVVDTGVGISKTDIEHIFEPFYTKKKMGRSGTGLGMTVVWGTVQDHKGHIGIESTQGRGTTLRIHFPATRKKPLKEQAGLAVESYMGEGQTILVVDDVREQRMIARMMLSQLGYTVETAPSGEAAIEYMRTHSAELLILDMIMDPGIDGLKTYTDILEIHPGQRAIITSGYSETAQVEKALNLGVGSFVKKPYTMEMIGQTVKKELNKAI
jgi:PAS domain S-box-containing protein